jgi:guanylate kinase
LKGAILVISGPSGSGKSSLVKIVSEKFENVYFSISTTTRKIRDGEINGVNYHFTDVDTFKKDIDDGLFLEWAQVHGNYYGTSLKPIIKAIKDGKLVIFDIDVQGHKIARDKLENVITSVFITTPSLSSLKQRLVDRATDSEEIIARRLNNALCEMTSIHEYDFLLINDDFDKASEELLAISKVETVELSKHPIDEDEFLSWGYWADSTSGLKMGGYVKANDGIDVTDEEYISSLISSKVIANYSGSVEGTVHQQLDGVISHESMSNGEVNLEFDFGTQAINGNVNFDTPSDNWRLIVDQGEISTGSFTLDHATAGTDSTQTPLLFKGDGKFFGSEAQAIGGGFSAVSSDAKTAIGVIQGKRD